MSTDSSSVPGIRDLISTIQLASENVSQANKENALTLAPYEKRKLLAVTKNLTEKLEGPDTAIWKVVFGVKTFVLSFTLSSRCIHGPPILS